MPATAPTPQIPALVYRARSPANESCAAPAAAIEGAAAGNSAGDAPAAAFKDDFGRFGGATAVLCSLVDATGAPGPGGERDAATSEGAVDAPDTGTPLVPEAVRPIAQQRKCPEDDGSAAAPASEQASHPAASAQRVTVGDKLMLMGSLETYKALCGLTAETGSHLRSLFSMLFDADDVAAFSRLCLPALAQLDFHLEECAYGRGKELELFGIGFDWFGMPRLRRLSYHGRVLPAFFAALEATSHLLHRIDLQPFDASEALAIPDRILAAVRAFGPAIDTSDGTAALARRPAFRPRVLRLGAFNGFDREWAALCGERWIGGLEGLEVRSLPTRALARGLPEWFPRIKVECLVLDHGEADHEEVMEVLRSGLVATAGARLALEGGFLAAECPDFSVPDPWG
ncbi:hypothetical protein DFJ74DRAFT_774986 [Hyaloraphidium curvatum]|nr:hypothetical protein DFJ74DRAFT_774986 [Hyaloraphidium curvatum]